MSCGHSRTSNEIDALRRWKSERSSDFSSTSVVMAALTMAMTRPVDSPWIDKPTAFVARKAEQGLYQQHRAGLHFVVDQHRANVIASLAK